MIIHQKQPWLTVHMFCLYAPLVLLIQAGSVFSLTVSKMFGSDMVVQCDRPIPVWGWGTNGEQVTVAFHGQTKQTTVDASGKWRVTLDAESAGGPYSLSISGSTAINYSNVMVGEVWICAGQSNMAYSCRQVLDCKTIAQNAASYPNIRILKLGDTSVVLRQDVTVTTAWSGGDSADAGGFSAIGYAFGVQIQPLINKPIGLISMALGGTLIEEFLSPSIIASDPEIKQCSDTLLTKNRMYNARIAPGAPFAVRGVLWYQGEQNGVNTHVYRRELNQFISMMRTLYGDPNLYFGIVQVASTTGQNFPPTRESQQIVASCFFNAGTVVSMDNTVDNIHPPYKLPVAQRLADLVLYDVYKQGSVTKKVSSVRSITFNGNKVRVSFANVGSGLKTSDGAAPKSFTLAGDDKTFHVATATIIDTGTIEVSSADEPAPASIRYAWDGFATVNLCNGGNHPIPTFRSDTWDTWQKYFQPADRTPPTTPANFTISSNANGFALSWSASADAVGVEEYCVYANGNLVAVTRSTTLQTSALSKNQLVWVKARDKSFNISNASAILPVPESNTFAVHPLPMSPDYSQIGIANKTMNYSFNLSGRRTVTRLGSAVYIVPKRGFNSRPSGRVITVH